MHIMKMKWLFLTIAGVLILATIGEYFISSAQTTKSDAAWAEAHRNIGRSNNRIGGLRHQVTQIHNPDFSGIQNFLNIINESTANINTMEAEGKHSYGMLKLHHTPIVGIVTKSVDSLNTAHTQYEAQFQTSIRAYQNAITTIRDSRNHPSFPTIESESKKLDDLLLSTVQLGNFSEQNLKSDKNNVLVAKVENLVNTIPYLQTPSGSIVTQSVQALLSNISLLKKRTQSVSEIEAALSAQGTELFNTIDQARISAQFRNNLIFVAAILQLLAMTSIFIYSALGLKRELVRQNLALEDTVALRTESLEAVLADLKLSTKQQTKTETRLRHALRAAEKAGKAKSAFLANMSHEIRTPMNGVLAMLELVLRDETDPEKLDHLKIAHSSARSLLNILDDVLDYSRLEAGQFTINPEPYELSTIIEEVVGLFRSKAETKDVSILTTFEKDLPKTVVGDHARVRQVLSNFLSNALKFTEHGQINVQVRREEGKQIRIDVTDTGIGISKSALTKLFQRFSQGDNSSTRRYGGTGLGLVICKQLVELMGGTVGVESVEGKGSNFWMILPNNEIDSKNLRATEALKNKTPESFPVDSPNYDLKILAAEDNLVNQKVLHAMTQSLGYAVTIVGNGHEVLEKLDSEPFDLILMDVQMPVMDGVSATKEIRALSSPVRDITIIALTANAMEGDRESYLAAGMDDYLPKPIERDKLAETLHRASLSVMTPPTQLSKQGVRVANKI